LAETRAARVQVRHLVAADYGPVVDLMRRQEFAEGLSAETLHRMFDYSWDGDRDDRGFVLDDGGRIVGFLVVAYSRRRVDGRDVGFCNMGSWYVEPPYRASSLALLRSLLALDDLTIWNLTANSTVRAIMEKHGFEVISRERFFCGPGAALARGASPACKVLDDPKVIEAIVSEEHRRILRDHLPYGCGHYALAEDGDYCFVVTKRRPLSGQWFLPRWLPRRVVLRNYPVSDLLHVSEPGLAQKHWARLQRRVMRRERTVGLTAEGSFLGFEPPRAVRIPHEVHVYRRRTDVRAIDALYTEIIFLPI
jgi:hypothetical protein